MIGFFDSGIGGLTVLQTALSRRPGLRALYYSDSDHLPYGEKTKEQIQEYALQAATFLCAQGAEALVVACNTATSAAVMNLRQALSIPVIGMEPAVSLACRYAQTPSDRILVLATRLTLAEEKYQNLLQRLEIAYRVDGVPLPELVQFAEQLCFDASIILPYLRSRLAGMDLSSYAAVVLGCTHFPFFRSLIQSLFPDKTRVVDGSAGTVENLFRHMKDSENGQESAPSPVRYFTSGRLIQDPAELNRIQQLLERIRHEDHLSQLHKA